MTPVFLMLAFLSIMARIWFTVKFTTVVDGRSPRQIQVSLRFLPRMVMMMLEENQIFYYMLTICMFCVSIKHLTIIVKLHITFNK